MGVKGLQMGQRAAAARVFSGEDVLAYRRLTGDVGLAFGAAGEAHRLVIPGPLLGGMISDLLGTRLPGPGTNWLKQRTVFVDAAYVGEAIEAAVEITRIRAEKELVNLRTTVTAAGERLICEGEALVLVKDLLAKLEGG